MWWYFFSMFQFIISTASILVYDWYFLVYLKIWYVPAEKWKFVSLFKAEHNLIWSWIFEPNFERNLIPFGSKSKGQLPPRSYSHSMWKQREVVAVRSRKRVWSEISVCFQFVPEFKAGEDVHSARVTVTLICQIVCIYII